MHISRIRLSVAMLVADCNHEAFVQCCTFYVLKPVDETLNGRSRFMDKSVHCTIELNQNTLNVHCIKPLQHFTDTFSI